MTNDEIDMVYPNLMLMEPREKFNSCIVGVIERAGISQCFCYDVSRVIAKLVEGGMTDTDAWEWFQFNMVSAYVGEHTPAFLYPFEVASC